MIGNPAPVSGWRLNTFGLPGPAGFGLDTGGDWPGGYGWTRISECLAIEQLNYFSFSALLDPKLNLRFPWRAKGMRAPVKKEINTTSGASDKRQKIENKMVEERRPFDPKALRKTVTLYTHQKKEKNLTARLPMR